MDEPTSKVVVAALGFAGTLLWPVVLVWTLHRFHQEILSILSRAKSIELGGLKLALTELVAQQQGSNLAIGYT
jgi:hypothetical protein